MKTYYICECCDCVFKTTESSPDLEQSGIDDLTGQEARGIIMEENERNNGFITGLCEECRAEIYGTDDRIVVYSYHGLN
ncbi:anti-sigma-F factor Fin [Desulfotruncus alcoholivorax]|uniref:anti-sigma-F factor Fin n=1 Tax=Desulfotruncus alcoholivorax TaxID=265477 RepID=UPI000411C7A6|nr:anti-sigma-F factor Fin [Desulfotruncus alcoholivorax]